MWMVCCTVESVWCVVVSYLCCVVVSYLCCVFGHGVCALGGNVSGVGCGFCSSEGTVGFVGVVEPWVFVCVCVVGKKWLLSCVCCEDGMFCLLWGVDGISL